MKKSIPTLLTILILGITTLLWINSKFAFSEISDTPLKSLDQIAALFATIFLAFEFVLATRLSFIEKMFSGLDKVYKAHHTSGAIAYSLVLLHPLFLILSVLPNSSLAYKYFLISDLLAYNLGVIAFYLFTLLIFVTLYLKLPYNIWKLTHNLFGIPMIFVLLHVILISSDVSNSVLLKGWMLTFVLIAILSFLYKRFFYNFFGGVYEYSVLEVRELGNKVLEITLKPKHDKLSFNSGQFVFISFLQNISSEKHPFTISSSKYDENLRFSINTGGDYTKNMGKINIGDNVLVYGPYGNLGYEFDLNNNDQVWLAGGIGVTPFLSRITSVPDNQNISFYYLTSTHEQAIYHNEIISKIGNRTNISYTNHCSTLNGHISYEVIKRNIRDIKNTRFFLCGPLRMVESMTEQLVNAGAKPSNIIFEEFDFKS